MRSLAKKSGGMVRPGKKLAKGGALMQAKAALKPKDGEKSKAYLS